jgi:flagellar biosynthesis/type III secretory pathway protein FliH
MLLTEWKHEEALVVRYEEGMEDGIAKGIAKGRAEGKAKGVAIGEARGRAELLALWEKGVPIAEAKRQLGLGRKRR